jgi:hypothetical protein
LGLPKSDVALTHQRRHHRGTSWRKALLNELDRVAFRKRFCQQLDELQRDLDAFLEDSKSPAAASRSLVLRQNAHEDVSQHGGGGEGEADRMSAGERTRPFTSKGGAHSERC